MVAHPYAPKSDCILFIIPLPSDSEVPNHRPVSCQLEVPLGDLKQLVLRPVRWLKLVAWGVLGCTGRVLNARRQCLHDDLLFDDFPPIATYTFQPDEGASFSVMNIQPFIKSGAHSDASSSSAGSYHSEGEDPLVAVRDGRYCVFSGSDMFDRAHILPSGFPRVVNPNVISRPARRDAVDQPTSLNAGARDFAFEDHLDARNVLTVGVLIEKAWRALGKCFVLATDPKFIRDQDVPQPRGPPPRGMRTRARAGVAGETYIWQSLVGKLLDADSSVLTTVRLNERARFASADPEPRPCARAINYVYAAGMVMLYRRPCQDGIVALSRPLPIPATRKRRRSSSEETMGEPSDIPDAAASMQVKRLQRDVEEATMRRVRDWRDGSAIVSAPE